MRIYVPKKKTGHIGENFISNDLHTQTGCYHSIANYANKRWVLRLTSGTLELYSSPDDETWTLKKVISDVKNAFFNYDPKYFFVHKSDSLHLVHVYRYDDVTGNYNFYEEISIYTSPAATTYTVYDALYNGDYIIIYYDGNPGFYIKKRIGVDEYLQNDTTRTCLGMTAHINKYYGNYGWDWYPLYLKDNSSDTRYVGIVDTTTTGSTVEYKEIITLPAHTNGWPRLLILDKDIKKRFYFITGDGGQVYNAETYNVSQFSNTAPLVLYGLTHPYIVTKDPSVSGRFHFFKIDRCGGAMYLGAYDFAGSDYGEERSAYEDCFFLKDSNGCYAYKMKGESDIIPFSITLTSERNSGHKLNFSVKEVWYATKPEWVSTDYGFFKIKNMSAHPKGWYSYRTISPALFEYGRKVYAHEELLDLEFSLSQDLVDDMFSRYSLYLEAPLLSTSSTGPWYVFPLRNKTLIEALLQFSYEVNTSSDFSTFIEEREGDEWKITNFTGSWNTVALNEDNIQDITILKDIDKFTYVKVEGEKKGADFPVVYREANDVKPTAQVCIAETPFRDQSVVERLADFLIGEGVYRKIRVRTSVDISLFDKVSVSYSSPRFEVSGEYYVKSKRYEPEANAYTYEIETFIFPFNIRYNEKSLDEIGSLRAGDRLATVHHYAHVDMYDPYFARPVQGAFIVIKGTTASAINSELNKLSSGGVAILPPGSYTLTETIVVPSRVKVLGYGVKIYGSVSPLIRLNAFSSIEGMEIWGNDASRSVEIAGNFSTISHCNFLNTMADYTHTAVYIPSNIERTFIIGSRFEGKFYFGVESHGKDTRVVANRFGVNKYGVALYNVYNTVVGNIFSSMGTAGIYINIGGGGSAMTIISGNTERYSPYAVQAYNSSYIMVIGNMFQDTVSFVSCSNYEADHNYP